MSHGKSFVEKILNIATDKNALVLPPIVTKCFRFSAN